MFGNRRRRAASNPPVNGANVNSNATSAAAQAFLKNRPSTASLAAAAAGAALRSRPTTPINVGEVQTKRTIRRSGSTSSIGSSVAGSSAPPSRLERRGSSGSMSERTFRDPSPGPTAPVPSAPDAPPVPLIPTSLRAPKVDTSGSHRRAASMEPPAMRVASPPPRANGRGSSLGPAATSQPPRTGHQRNTSLSSVQEYDRPASRGSVNFSYPTNARPESPHMQGRRLTSPSRANPARIVSPTNQNLIYDPNTRKFLPEAEILAIEQRLYDAAQKPVKKKKKAPSQNTGTGIHLGAGTASHFLGPKGTAVDQLEAARQQPPQAVPPVELAAHVPEQRSAPSPAPVTATVSAPEPAPIPAKKKKKKVKVVESESDEGSYQPNSSDTDSDRSAKPATFNTRVGPMLAKRPSVVREDREREEEEDDTPVKAKAQDGPFPLFVPPQEERSISPSPLPRSQAGRGRGGGPAPSAALTSGRQKTSSSESSPIEADVAAVKMRDSVRGGRVQSISPARAAHFAATPESLAIKHQPPPRAISPRKSAMKHSGTDSPRAQSPLPGFVPEASEATGGELSVPKKKANRVSFDEHNIVVGTAAGPVTTDSPVVASPQNKRTWLPFGRGKKKETTVLDDDDEVMQPRPALPSFGSVREKKIPREAEPERPLVKPTETVEYKPLETSAPPIVTSSTGEVLNNPLGQSKDHAAGALLAQEAASKNAANISKSREPLPPQVLSVEGSGETSESEESEGKKSNGHLENGKPTRGPENAEEQREIEDDVPTPRAGSPTSEAPQIQVLQATPTLEETGSKREWPDMPGAWGSTTESSNSDSGKDDTQPLIVEHQPTEPTIADLGISEPDPIVHSSPPVGEIALQNSIHAPIMEEQEPESEADSIYSDAAEDLSEPEGDGFMSLDAVADSPVSKIAVPIGIAIPPAPLSPKRDTDSPTPVVVKERAFKQSRLSQGSTEPEVDESWENVQRYWKTLTAEQKKQLELEAKEAAEGSDTETEVKPEPKPKKKKKKAVAPPEPIVQPQRQPTVNERQYGFQPGAKAGPHGHPPASSMRTSMRSEPPKPTAVAANGDAHIRKSMRGPTSMRGSLRAEVPPEPRGSLQKKYRPISYPAPVDEVKADPTAVQMHVRALSAASAKAAEAARRDTNAPPMPTLRRRGSSDSQSSFKKKKRPASVASTMRSSMRGSQDLDQPSPMPPLPSSSRFSIRSLSPTGSGLRRPFSSASNMSQPTGPPTHMRSSMRSTVGPAPTMRTRPASSSGFFGRSSSAKPDKKKSAAALKPKSSSRFADSSDEEDARPSFRSRFVDSSDEDEPSSPLPAKSKQVRVPPRRTATADGDSSDLPDSDDGAAGPASPPITSTKSTGTTTAQGSTLATGSLRAPPIPVSTTPRPPTGRRGSFMSTILRRKKDTNSGGIRKSDLESPVRRDTPLERSKSDLQALKLASPTSSTPKLVKRNTGLSSESRTNSGLVPTLASPKSEGAGGEAWPLPAPHPVALSKEGEEGRPYTADGEPSILSTGEERPDMPSRRFTATGLSGVDLGLGNEAIVVAGEGVGTGDSVGSAAGGKKKKKFGSLRRLFRLDE